MNRQTKTSMSRFMMLWLIITWAIPTVLEIYRPGGPLWIGIVAAGSPLLFVFFIVLINKSLIVKYYTQRAYAITMLITATIAIITRMVLVIGAYWINVSILVYLVSVIGFIASLTSLLLFNYEAFED
ncbi:hypothetical protein C3R74_10400 [Acidithiobacillus ferridurans]|jgi:hypothetical protein|nr:hypothetical protein C3R74_10400 [Acidithiobacillus ferridurans]